MLRAYTSAFITLPVSFILIFLNVLTISFSKLGLSPDAAFMLLFAILIGSTIIYHLTSSYHLQVTPSLLHALLLLQLAAYIYNSTDGGGTWSSYYTALIDEAPATMLAVPQASSASRKRALMVAMGMMRMEAVTMQAPILRALTPKAVAAASYRQSRGGER
jgi:hypothetical protein